MRTSGLQSFAFPPSVEVRRSSFDRAYLIQDVMPSFGSVSVPSRSKKACMWARCAVNSKLIVDGNRRVSLRLEYSYVSYTILFLMKQ